MIEATSRQQSQSSAIGQIVVIQSPNLVWGECMAPVVVLKGMPQKLRVSHSDGFTLPEQQSLLAAFLHGLHRFWMPVLPVKNDARGNTQRGGCASQQSL